MYMTRAKKLLSYSLIALLGLLLVAYLTANWLLDSYSREALPALAQRAERQGVVISDPQFAHARIAGVRTARWTDLAGQLQFSHSDAFDPDQTFEVHVGQADLWLLGGGQATLEARDISVDSTDTSAEEPGAPANAPTQREQIRAERFRCQFELDLFHPLPSLEQTLPELMRLLQAGATQMPVETEGTLEFTLKNTPVKARIRVDQIEGGQALVIVPEDLRPISKLFDEALTEAETELIATYPLRVAKLLRIKDDAETTSEAAKRRDDQVPQDAYRHVLWSFLLTRQYGAPFAERVTDAHEQGDTGNTPAEREMDLHNNAIGRRWAEQDLRRKQILERVLSDPDVIGEPQ